MFQINSFFIIERIMFILSLFAFALIGVTAGLLAGLLGISGGVVTIPLLVLMFNMLQFDHLCLMQLAIGTSLAAMVINAFSSTMAHHRRGKVTWPVVRAMAPGVFVGCISGAFVARLLPGDVLKLIFGVFECLLGIYFFKKIKPYEGENRLPGKWALSGIGYGIGGISNILGIGGGIITVPTLMAFKLKPRRAVATSSAVGFMISVLGASSYLYFGLTQECMVKYSIGYLYVPAFVAISIASAFTAPYGAKLAHTLEPTLLRRIFGGALIIAGSLMIFN